MKVIGYTPTAVQECINNLVATPDLPAPEEIESDWPRRCVVFSWGNNHPTEDQSITLMENWRNVLGTMHHSITMTKTVYYDYSGHVAIKMKVIMSLFWHRQVPDS